MLETQERNCSSEVKRKERNKRRKNRRVEEKEERKGREKRKRLLRILWKHSKYFTLWDFYLQFHLVNHEGFKPYARHFKT